MNREMGTSCPWVETTDTRLLHSVDQALDLLGFYGFGQKPRLLIHHKHLSSDFFDLKTGLAGEIFQKFANYNVRAALVLNQCCLKGRFAELVLELNRGGPVRVFHSSEEAMPWLCEKKYD
ncbi:MAG: DUF4180 domain-containing protein [Spirochaetales bacterium]|nr:DUF4180 domain-containing protein [Spirochaetales bacterium]